MPGLAAYRPRLQALLGDVVGSHRVPGAACGVLLQGETAVVTTGVANLSTGIEVTPDTLFQIGSLSKLYTSTLVLQAHSAGVLGLDEPVRSQLQSFTVSDPGAILEITPRHLLTHTSGIAGDHLHDTGWNGDALQKYVDTLAPLGQIHGPDEAYSFCNTGFGVAGRLLEVVTGQDFDQVLRRRLSRPLGCTATLTLPQHLLLRRVAAGHQQEPGGEPVRQTRWTLTRSNGPMGGVVATAGDVLAFTRLHLEGGRAASGGEVLPAAAVGTMTEPHIDTPIPGEAQALGWTCRRWGERTCLAQDADTFGQRAFLRVVPTAGFALCLLTNSPLGAAVARDLLPRVAGDLLEVDATRPQDVPVPPAEPFDPTPYVGTYGRLHQRLLVQRPGEGQGPATELSLTIEPSGVLAALGARHATVPLRPVDLANGVFVLTDPATGVDELVVFDDGIDTSRAVHLDGRLHRRWAI